MSGSHWKHSTPQRTHFFQRCFHFLKPSWYASFVMVFSYFVAFALISEIVSNLLPLRGFLSFGNKKKSQGARSRKKVGWGRTVIECLAKNSRVLSGLECCRDGKTSCHLSTVLAFCIGRHPSHVSVLQCSKSGWLWSLEEGTRGEQHP